MKKKTIMCLAMFQVTLCSSAQNNDQKFCLPSIHRSVKPTAIVLPEAARKNSLPSIHRSVKPTAIVLPEAARKNSLSSENSPGLAIVTSSKKKSKNSVSFALSLVSPASYKSENDQSENDQITPELISPPGAPLVFLASFLFKDASDLTKHSNNLFFAVTKYALLFADKIQKDLQGKQENFADFFVNHQQEARYKYYLSFACKVEQCNQIDHATFQNYLSSITACEPTMFHNFIEDHVSKLMILRQPNEKNIQDVICKLSQEQKSLITWTTLQKAICDVYRIDSDDYSLTEEEQNRWIAMLPKNYQNKS